MSWFDPLSRLRRRLHAAPPLLIYQMGKVGSSSLKVSLTPNWPGLTIQAHNLIHDKDKRRRVSLVYDRVIQKGAPVFIISPVREPIDRNISAFFQKFERDTGVKYSKATFPIQELIGIFLRNYHHDTPLTWFDKHLKPLFGIDVYNYGFPANGVQVIQHNNTKLLLMRSELPDSVKQSAVRDFLSMPDFLLASANVGSQKEYGETYRRFRDAFIAPDWYIKQMYESKFFNHFYDNAHKNNCIKKWTRT